jgi:hypothetical protein
MVRGHRRNQVDTRFNVSARGWCHILEEHELEKGDFDVAELEAPEPTTNFVSCNGCKKVAGPIRHYEE